MSPFGISSRSAAPMVPLASMNCHAPFRKRAMRCPDEGGVNRATRSPFDMGNNSCTGPLMPVPIGDQVVVAGSNWTRYSTLTPSWLNRPPNTMRTRLGAELPSGSHRPYVGRPTEWGSTQSVADVRGTPCRRTLGGGHGAERCRQHQSEGSAEGCRRHGQKWRLVGDRNCVVERVQGMDGAPERAQQHCDRHSKRVQRFLSLSGTTSHELKEMRELARHHDPAEAHRSIPRRAGAARRRTAGARRARRRRASSDCPKRTWAARPPPIPSTAGMARSIMGAELPACGRLTKDRASAAGSTRPSTRCPRFPARAASDSPARAQQRVAHAALHLSTMPPPPPSVSARRHRRPGHRGTDHSDPGAARPAGRRVPGPESGARSRGASRSRHHGGHRVPPALTAASTNCSRS
jgi:hypothetical protein